MMICCCVGVELMCCCVGVELMCCVVLELMCCCVGVELTCCVGVELMCCCVSVELMCCCVGVELMCCCVGVELMCCCVGVELMCCLCRRRTDTLLCRCIATADLSLHSRHCSAISNTPVTVVYYTQILLLFMNTIKGKEMICLKGPSYQINVIFSTAHDRTFWSGPHHKPFLLVAVKLSFLLLQ